MTKDMFEKTTSLSYEERGKESMAKAVVASIFDKTSSLDETDISHEVPKVSYFQKEKGEFCIQTISIFKQSSSKFIHEFIYLETESNKELEVESFCSLPFRFFELDAKRYLVTETVLKVQDLTKLDKALLVIQNLQAQLRLGLRSTFYARMVMEMKGNSLDGKTSYVQERLVNFIHRFPSVFDYDLIPIMNQFLKGIKGQFVKDRAVKDLSRMILSLYLFSKKISERAKLRNSAGREIYVKTHALFVEELFGRKKVLGICVGLSHLRENERLGKDHLVKACKKFVRGAVFVEDSFFKVSASSSGGCLYYFEIEKKDGGISLEDKHALESGLAKYLEVHIQKLTRKIFMPQNTEEVIKYTVALSKELRSKEDYPQVAVLFDSQASDTLIFTVIIVRAKIVSTTSAFEIFTKTDEKGYDFRIKHVRSLGEFKEGIEVSYKLRIAAFMREDYTVDIYRARGRIIADLQKKFGVIRDYNGGMLEKQGGRLAELIASLRKGGVKNSVLVENFFYAIYPSEMRAILDVETFSEFFMNFYSLFSYKVAKDTSLNYTEDKVIFIARVRSEKKKDAFLSEVKKFDEGSFEVVYFSLLLQEKYYLGATYRFEEESMKKEFVEKIAFCLR